MLHGWWLILLVSLPLRPSSLRVRAWRRLRALGAVALKSGAYLLPDTGDRYEQFQWLTQEVQRDGGVATLLRVERVENMEQPGIIRLFHEARNQDCAALADRYRKLLYAVASGFRQITGDDFENMRLQFPLYDALYAYCRTARA